MEVGVMPREQITHNQIIDRRISQQTYGVEDVPDAIVHVEVPRRNVHVSWDRTGWVQLGIDMTIAELRGLLDTGVKEAEAAARAHAHIGEYATDQHQVRVVSDVLDRAEVNATVRTLRVARDRAYGRDE